MKKLSCFSGYTLRERAQNRDINVTLAPKAHSFILPAGLPSPSPDKSYAESHDRVHDIVVVLPEGLDGLLAGDVSLGHDKVNVLGLEAGLINLLAVVLLFFLLGLDFGGLALAVVVVMVVVVVVTSVLTTGGLGGGQLLSSGSLGLGVQVLNLGLAEDAALCQFCFSRGHIECWDSTYIQVLLEGDL